jgi:beta-glucosidase
MPGPTRRREIPAVLKAIHEGSIKPETINDRARSILQLLKRTGKLEDRRQDQAERAVDLPEHRRLIRQAGSEGLVLLKNENAVLPIDTKKNKRIAVLGPLAKQAAAHGGGSAMLSPHYKITAWDALQRRIGSTVDLSYAQGACRARSTLEQD